MATFNFTRDCMSDQMDNDLEETRVDESGEQQQSHAESVCEKLPSSDEQPGSELEPMVIASLSAGKSIIDLKTWIEL